MEKQENGSRPVGRPKGKSENTVETVQMGIRVREADKLRFLAAAKAKNMTQWELFQHLIPYETQIFIKKSE